jgi:hypothetical protein
MNIQKIPNQIIKQPLQYLNLSKVDSIALHHMAHPTADVKTVEGWHINQGWRAFGYNFWVGFDGTVYEGRGFKLGAGVENHNGHIISIGFQGDYHSKDISMPNAQFNAGVDIIKYVMEKVPTARFIGGHREFMSTACPGDFFPAEEMKTLKKRGSQIKEITSVNDIVWEYAHRGIISDKSLWLKKLNEDENSYWLARKTLQYIREKEK